MPRKIPPSISLAMGLLRQAHGWSKKELAAALGTTSSVLSEHETGKNPPKRQRLEAILSVMGISPEKIHQALVAVQWVRPADPDAPDEGSEESPGSPLDPTPAERAAIEQAAEEVGRVAQDMTRLEGYRKVRADHAREARQEADALWEVLEPLSERERRLLVSAVPELWTWAVCERLCAESERAAADDARRAYGLARLALRVAARVLTDDAFRSRLRGYSWALVANALRVANFLLAADRAMGYAWKLWESGAAVDPAPLDGSRLLDLEASLRRAQRRFDEAIQLLDRALGLTASTEGSGRILLKKSYTFEQMGDYHRAAETLREAAPLVDGRRDPRLPCVLRFNLAVNLCHAGRHGEAVPVAAEVRAIAVRLRNEIDMVRVLWLEGRVAAGLGREEVALAALEQARREFADRRMSYDAALVSLELAALHLEQGRTAEVKALACEMEPIFRDQEVHDAAMAALRLFRDAVERETVTVELTHRLVAYLYRARTDPRLAFEA
ncbi:MAG TPA: helix-turn-helix domain-containing protein [Thermoanaerobaculia bacterium]|nr:helix-turn-helix domain-containing protein [Thermoanaerobaculia bacterium]